ncbi:hypothetical protein AV650_15670 [Serratia fonticola]|nr:hypothetical protein AV650_15670 [Serratia fonticola]
MTLCVLGDTVLAKSRHLMEGDCVTAKFTALACENDEGNDEYMYWIEPLGSDGEKVMKEISCDFITACDIYDRLKKLLGADVA